MTPRSDLLPALARAALITLVLALASLYVAHHPRVVAAAFIHHR